MRKLLLSLLLLFPLAAFAAGGGKSCGEIECDAFEVDLHDKESQQRGAKYFVNYCMGCHSMKFMRYERFSDDLGIPHEITQQNLNFSGSNIGNLMEIAADKQAQKKWFGAAPPDLTLVARLHKPEWLYTYLRTFYEDPSRPYGVNNLVFPSVGMPHVMLELQGMQKCAPGPLYDVHGNVERDTLTNEPILFNKETGEALNPCGSFTITKKGSMEPAQFDQAVADLVNFLAYAGEPTALKRERMGVYALFFIALFFVMAWLLNREYWKDIH